MCSILNLIYPYSFCCWIIRVLISQRWSQKAEGASPSSQRKHTKWKEGLSMDALLDKVQCLKMDVVTTKLKEIWLVLRRWRFFLGGCCLQFGRGELGWERRRRNREEGRQSGNILTFTDGIIDGLILLVIPLAILTVNRSCHCTEIPI